MLKWWRERRARQRAERLALGAQEAERWRELKDDLRARSEEEAREYTLDELLAWAEKCHRMFPLGVDIYNGASRGAMLDAARETTYVLIQVLKKLKAEEDGHV